MRDQRDVRNDVTRRTAAGEQHVARRLHKPNTSFASGIVRRRCCASAPRSSRSNVAINSSMRRGARRRMKAHRHRQPSSSPRCAARRSIACARSASSSGRSVNTCAARNRDARSASRNRVRADATRRCEQQRVRRARATVDRGAAALLPTGRCAEPTSASSIATRPKSPSPSSTSTPPAISRAGR